MRGRKGQSAMEYLMTYGWAILVVMIVGIAMWRLGIFNMGGTTMTSTAFAKIKPQLAATGMKANGDFNGAFTNGVGTTVKVKAVVLNKSSTSCQMSQSSTNFVKAGSTTVLGDALAGNPLSVGAGDNFQVHFTGPSGCGITGSAGDVYTLSIIISYDSVIGTQVTSHTEKGSIRGPFES